MKGPTRKKELAWLSEPNPSLIDGLISSGLIPSNTSFVSSTRPMPNLKPAQDVNILDSKKSSRSSKTSQSQRPKKMTPNVRFDQTKRNIQNNQLSTSRSAQGINNIESLTFCRPSTCTPAVIEQPLPSIDELLSTKRKYAGPKDAQSLSREYHSIISNDDIDDSVPPERQSSALASNFQGAFLIWNKFNVQLRSFSEEHAVLLVEIKQFFQERLERFPQISQNYVKMIQEAKSNEENAKKELEQSICHNAEKEEIIFSLQDQIVELTESNEALRIDIQDLNEKIDNMEFNAEMNKNEQSTLLLRLQRSEEQRGQLQLNDSSQKELIESLQKQIKSHESIISKYEQDGAGYRPMYYQAMEDMKILHDNIETLHEEVENLKKQPKYTDFGVLTDTMVTQANDTPQKPALGKKKTRNNMKTIDFRDLHPPSLDTIIDQKPQVNPIERNSSLNIIVNPPPSTANKIPIPIIETPPPPMPPVIELESTPILPKAEKSLDLSTDYQEPTVLPSSSIPMPSDYAVNHGYEIEQESIVNCVFRLLPLPIGTSLEHSPESVLDMISNDRRTQSKPYFWVLRHIVNFFSSLAGVEQLSDFSMGAISLAKQKLIRESGIESIANRIFFDIIQSSQFFKLDSQAVNMYLQFMLQELNIVDLKFFQMLFSLCLEMIYPSVNESINDPDIFPVTPQFLIHTDIAKKIFRSFFAHLPESDLNIDEIRNETPYRIHPDLITFWGFGMKMITFFRKTHVQFHRQVSGLLSLIGWDQCMDMTDTLFKQFFIIVNPSISFDDLKRLWERFNLDKTYRGERSITNMTFIRFCSDFPELSISILILPYLETFDREISKLSDPLLQLVKFLRIRFTTFVRKVNSDLPKNIQERLSKWIFAIRNSLIRCDISSAVAAYRHFLQTIDLKLTEENPYITISQQISPEGCDELKQTLLSRETLIAKLIGTIYSEDIVK